MTKLPFSFKVTTTDQELERMSLIAIRDFLNQKLPTVAKEAEIKIADNIKRIFIGSPAYEALVNGPLDAHFGIPKGEALPRLDAIINTMADSVRVDATRITIAGTTLRGGIKVSAIKGDFTDLLVLPEAKVQTDKGQELPWLEWLLIRGDAIIISNYQITFGNYNRSRSGAALMLKSTSKSWRVPVGVSGTANNNWITRAVDDAYNFVDTLIAGAIEDSMNKVF